MLRFLSPVLGRLAMVQALVQQAGDEVDDGTTAIPPEFAEHGTYDRALLEAHDVDPICFTAHFFRVAELEALLAEAGVEMQHVVGLEGIASLRRVEGSLDDLDDDQLAAVTDTVDLLREDRSVADISTHILAAGRASSSRSR